jgi:hypothetical protein
MLGKAVIQAERSARMSRAKYSTKTGRNPDWSVRSGGLQSPVKDHPRFADKPKG